MAKTIASLVLVLLDVAMLNGYGAEGARRDNQHKKDDGVLVFINLKRQLSVCFCIRCVFL